MQLAAYIAKFAAIFVWFFWLCSNVQTVSSPKLKIWITQPDLFEVSVHWSFKYFSFQQVKTNPNTRYFRK